MTYIMEPLCQARLYWVEREDLFVMITRIDALGAWLVEELTDWGLEPEWLWTPARTARTMREALDPYRSLNPNILYEEAL